jgi:hypothetical protein
VERTSDWELVLPSVGISAVFLFFLMVLVLFTNRGDRGRGTFALFLVNVMTFPILAASIFALLASPNGPSEYWATAPWLVILGGTAYIGFSAVLAVVTGLVYLLTRGDNAKKARWSLGCFTILFPATLALMRDL